jgi:hypothetical protein
MQVFILGINHQIQWVRLWSTGSSRSGEIERFEQDQKDKFRQLLRRTIAEKKAQFLGEETKHKEPSIAEEVCGQGCLYANIEMDPDERARQDIPANYENDPAIPASEKARFNELRENHMFREAMTKAGNADSIIIICGRNHSPTLADKFRAVNCNVEVSDIQNESWYMEDWVSQMMQL